MKKTILVTIFSLFVFSLAMGQDLETVTGQYNQGATLLESNKEMALKSFEQALTGAKALGDAGADMLAKCKEIIPSLYLSIAKEKVMAKDMAAANANIANAIKFAKEFSNQEVVKEATELISMIGLQDANEKLSKKDYKGAIEAYKKVIAQNPQDAMANLRLGMAYSRLGDETNTVAALKKAAELGMADAANKEQAIFFLKKAAAFLKTKKLTDAYSYAEKSIAALKTPQALNIAGKCALALKKNKEAIEHFEGYLAMSPKAKDAPSVMYQIAVACEAAGDKAKACGYYKQIMNNPTFKEFATHKVKNELKCN